MAFRRVTCIARPYRNLGYEGIIRLGGFGWNEPVEQVMADIAAETHVYYTSDGVTHNGLRVVQGESGPYLRTDTEPVSVNNLLNLPDC